MRSRGPGAKGNRLPATARIPQGPSVSDKSFLSLQVAGFHWNATCALTLTVARQMGHVVPAAAFMMDWLYQAARQSLQNWCLPAGEEEGAEVARAHKHTYMEARRGNGGGGTGGGWSG